MKTMENPIKMKDMTAKEVAEECGVSWVYLRKWCKNNNIKRKLGKQGVMEYDLSKIDIQKFKNRNKQVGKPKADGNITK